MERFYRATRVEVSLDALAGNLRAFREVLPVGMKTMAVVKGNAYGHGAVKVAEEAVACGVDYLGVAFLDEALELRQAGITAPVLVLGFTGPEGLDVARDHDVTLTVFTDEVLAALQQMPEESHKLKIHVKLDTGMGRIGLHEEATAVDFIQRAIACPGVEVEGLFTHYACADETDKSYTLEQHRRFQAIVDRFAQHGRRFALLHAGNSATAIDMPELSFNMVRLGISMYGMYPSEEVNKSRIELQPVLSYKTRVVMVKTVPQGTAISYGATYRAAGEEKIATLPVGYADGFSRMLSGKCEAIVRGRRVPVVGRICMDQCMLNVSGVPDVQPGDEVVLIGRQGDAVLAVEEVAAALGTINYEVTCMVSNRVPRVYIRDGATVQTVNGLWK
ncbi:alanine racemase [Paenibacillus sp. y28]|uniref:alanine racemase n=1 Tax=Paenibacillus sp. y28 TaxID=3129110 RepID=UPI00301781F4